MCSTMVLPTVGRTMFSSQSSQHLSSSSLAQGVLPDSSPAKPTADPSDFFGEFYTSEALNNAGVSSSQTAVEDGQLAGTEIVDIANGNIGQLLASFVNRGGQQASDPWTSVDTSSAEFKQWLFNENPKERSCDPLWGSDMENMSTAEMDVSIHLASDCNTMLTFEDNLVKQPAPLRADIAIPPQLVANADIEAACGSIQTSKRGGMLGFSTCDRNGSVSVTANLVESPTSPPNEAASPLDRSPMPCSMVRSPSSPSKITSSLLAPHAMAPSPLSNGHVDNSPIPPSPPTPAEPTFHQPALCGANRSPMLYSANQSQPPNLIPIVRVPSVSQTISSSSSQTPSTNDTISSSDDMITLHPLPACDGLQEAIDESRQSNKFDLHQFISEYLFVQDEMPTEQTVLDDVEAMLSPMISAPLGVSPASSKEEPALSQVVTHVSKPAHIPSSVPRPGAGSILEGVLRGTLTAASARRAAALTPAKRKTPASSTSFKHGLSACPSVRFQSLGGSSTGTSPSASPPYTSEVPRVPGLKRPVAHILPALPGASGPSRGNLITLKTGVTVSTIPTSSHSIAESSPSKKKSSSQRKKKPTKRSSVDGDMPPTRGRLLHFCPLCQKGFKDKYSVNVHIRTHTGEKPFHCSLCTKCFRQKAHLAKHIHIHNTPKPPPGTNKR